jgi:hypothetical protein
MASIQVAIVNRSSTIPDQAIPPVVAALQKQVSNDFATVWGIDADLCFINSQSQPAANQWWLGIFDTSDQAGALGYHDLTDQGLPLGKVFAQTDMDYDENWTITASHELLEMLADPDINLCAIDELSGSNARLYAYEVCDPCQSDDAAYLIDGVSVSDFVYPSWFEGLWANSANKPKFDQQGVFSAPFQLHANGYMSIMDVASQQGWVQVFGDRGPTFAGRAAVGSRRERRRTLRGQWQRSEPFAPGNSAC